MKRFLTVAMLAALCAGVQAMDESVLRILLVGSPEQARAWADGAGDALNQDIFVDLRPLMLVADRFDPAAPEAERSAILSVYAHFLQRGARPDPWSSARVGDAARLKAILEGDPGKIGFVTATGDTLLCAAVKSGSLECLSLLLDRKADTGESDARGSTPLMYAAERGDLAMARALLDGGADPSLPGESGLTPLAAARKAGKADMARLLAERGAVD